MRHAKKMLLDFWKDILSLPFGRRIVFFSSLVAFLSLFLPWVSTSATGNDGYFMIFGIITCAITIFSILLVLREIFFKKGFLGSFSHGKILIFLFAQGVYTIILATFVFHELILKILPGGDVHMGLGLTFASLGMGLVGAIFSRDFIPKGIDQKIFANPDDIDPSRVHLRPEDPSQLSFDEQQ